MKKEPASLAVDEPVAPSSENPAFQAVDGPDGAGTPRSITVRCGRAQGIWRAGRFWPSTPTTLPADELDEQQWAAIMAEPLLMVREE